MDTNKFSPATVELLSRYGTDPMSAIDAVPDAELQAVSPRYAEARQQGDEASVKAMLKESLGMEPQPAAAVQAAQESAAPVRPPSEREQFLQRLADFATVPAARALIVEELERERAVQELTILIAAAERAGDDGLASKLTGLLGADEQGPEDDGQGDGLSEEEAAWLEAADAEAREAGIDDEEPPQDPAAEPPAGDPASAAAPGADELAGRLKEAWRA